jgi:hypothetical protein
MRLADEKKIAYNNPISIRTYICTFVYPIDSRIEIGLSDKKILSFYWMALCREGHRGNFARYERMEGTNMVATRSTVRERTETQTVAATAPPMTQADIAATITTMQEHLDQEARNRGQTSLQPRELCKSQARNLVRAIRQ